MFNSNLGLETAMECPTNTPLTRKLGIKADAHLLLVDAPAGFLAMLAPLPVGVVLQTASEAETEGDLDVIVWFLRDAATLRERFIEMASCLSTAGGIWVCWPKRSSGIVSDLSDGVVREVGLAGGLVDNKVCAIDATWSALRFVRRLSSRGAASGK